MFQPSLFARVAAIVIGAHLALAGTAHAESAAPHKHAVTSAKKKTSKKMKKKHSGSTTATPRAVGPNYGKVPRSIAPKFEPPKLTGQTGRSLIPHGRKDPQAGASEKTRNLSLPERPVWQIYLAGKRPSSRSAGGSGGRMTAMSMDTSGRAITPPPGSGDGGGSSSSRGGSAGSSGSNRTSGSTAQHHPNGTTTFRWPNGSFTDVWPDGTFHTENADGTSETNHSDGSTDYYGKDRQQTGHEDADNDPNGQSQVIPPAADPKSLPEPIAPEPSHETDDEGDEEAEQ